MSTDVKPPRSKEYKEGREDGYVEALDDVRDELRDRLKMYRGLKRERLFKVTWDRLSIMIDHTKELLAWTDELEDGETLDDQS